MEPNIDEFKGNGNVKKTILLLKIEKMNKNNFKPNSYLPYGLSSEKPLNISFLLFMMKVLLEKSKGMMYEPEHRRDDYRGFFSLFDVKQADLIFDVPFGDVENAPIEKQDKYFEIWPEKSIRLYDNLPLGHTTSMQSRDESKLMFGGSVRITTDLNFNDIAPDIDVLLSFSGRPELCDEGMMLALGHGVGYLCNTRILPTEADNRNPYWERFKHLLLNDDRIKYMRFV